jgi:hypothetical protein
MYDPMQVLHDEIVLETADDALAFIAACGRNTPAGAAVLLFADDERRPCEILAVVDGAECLRDIVDLVCPAVEASYLLIVVNRSDERPADRPDDELLWMELVAAADDHGMQLLDWMVIVSPAQAFSVAEFAPLPAAW